MKRLSTLLLLFVALATTAQTPKTIKAAWEIQQTDNAKVNARIDSLLSALKVQPTPTLDPVPVPQPPVDNGKKVADFVSAYYSTAGAVVEGGVVTKLKAVKGGVDIPYDGAPAPTLGKPFLSNGELVFRNQSDVYYKIQTRDNDKQFSLPEEQTIVFTKLPGQDWEAIVSGWGNYYIGFGGGKIRVDNPNGFLDVQAAPENFKLSFIHVRFDADGATVWLNGTLLGRVVTTDMSRRMSYGVGIETNSTDFHWNATMFIERGMTDVERQDYFAAITREFNIGSLPDKPYASDVKSVQKGTSFTAAYTYNGTLPEDTAKTEIQWYERQDAGAFVYKLLGKGRTINYSGSLNIRPVVKVYDVQGNSWDFVNGSYQK